MKIVFATFRHDPLKTSDRQGADRQFLEALVANGHDCYVIGPFNDAVHPLEKVFRAVIKSLSGQAYMKYNMTNTINATKVLNKFLTHNSPDLVFSLYPSSLAFYRGSTPCVFRTDATIRGVLKDAPDYLEISPLMRWFTLWMEKKALRRSIAIITHSDWTKDTLIQEYGIDQNRVFVLPNPSSLGTETLNMNLARIKVIKSLNRELELLFVGTDPKRKGLSVALEIVKLLNMNGNMANLTICGVRGESSPNIHYAGKLDLGVPEQLNRYISYLENAHFLLHPALFDPAPRVAAEAAAYGTPTITNNTGGLATSVKDGVSGVVLPKDSPASAYVQAITDLVADPDRYYLLCKSTFERYEEELNWEVAGRRLSEILEGVVKTHAQSARTSAQRKKGL